MRKTTAALGAVALGTTGLMLVPATASAEECGVLNQTQFQSTFSPWGGAQIVGADSLSISSDGSAGGATGAGVPLADVTQDDVTFEFSTVAGTPLGYHLAVDLGDEGTTQLVYEPESYPSGDWWSTEDLANVPNRQGGMGSEDYGSLQDFSQAYPDAQVTGFGYEIWNGSSQLEAIGLGGCVYTFDALANPAQDGTDGQNGEDGQNGTDGQDGAQGPAGPAGPQGPAGPAGPQGATGATGATGTVVNSQFAVVPNTSKGIDTGSL